MSWCPFFRKHFTIMVLTDRCLSQGGPQPSGAVLSSSHVRLKWTALLGLLWSFEAVFYSPFSFFFFIAVSYRETVPAFRCIAPQTNLYQSTLLLPFLLSSTAKLVAFACQNSETVWCLWTIAAYPSLFSYSNFTMRTVYRDSVLGDHMSKLLDSIHRSLCFCFVGFENIVPSRVKTVQRDHSGVDMSNHTVPTPTS